VREEFKLFSLLTQYPSDLILAGSPEIVSAAGNLPPGAVRSQLTGFLAWWCATPPEELRALYIQTFELSAGTTLNLTYHRYGDGKERGAALLRLKRRLGDAGYSLDTGELPDYLPLLLEFAAVSPAGLDLVGEQRAPLEAVRLRLEGMRHAWAALFQAIAGALPPLTAEQKEETAAILQRGVSENQGSPKGRRSSRRPAGEFRVPGAW